MWIKIKPHQLWQLILCVMCGEVFALTTEIESWIFSLRFSEKKKKKIIQSWEFSRFYLDFKYFVINWWWNSHIFQVISTISCNFGCVNSNVWLLIWKITENDLRSKSVDTWLRAFMLTPCWLNILKERIYMYLEPGHQLVFLTYFPWCYFLPVAAWYMYFRWDSLYLFHIIVQYCMLSHWICMLMKYIRCFQPFPFLRFRGDLLTPSLWKRPHARHFVSHAMPYRSQHQCQGQLNFRRFVISVG